MIQAPALFRPAPPPASPIRFALIGWGWRARQFACIAGLAPAWFELTGLLRQKPDGNEPVKVASDLDMLVRDKPDFVVLSVPRVATPGLLIELSRRGVPVLTETPPATDVEGLRRLWREMPEEARVQVAEQYPLQPYHMAVAAVIRSGRLGRPHHVQVSVAHDYHGVALLRQFLGAGRTPVKLRAMEMSGSVIAGPNRQGAPTSERNQNSTQLAALLDFGTAGTGSYDFVGDQYMSWIRSSRLLVRGDRGEVANDTVRWLKAFDTPVRLDLTRFDGGRGTNLQGLAHQGYALGDEMLYLNPFGTASMPDDFIAMASTIWSMQHYLETGKSRYSLADGCHDHAVGLALAQAAREGRELVVADEPWMER